MGTTSEKLTYLNTTKEKIKDSLNLGGANITNETFREYANKLKDLYVYYMNNGLDIVWENWEKVIGSGTTLTLNQTLNAPMKLEYNGNTSQSGTPTPDSPQDVHVVTGDNTIKVVGKNLINMVEVNKGVNAQGNISNINNQYLGVEDYIPVKPNTTYTITFQHDIAIDGNKAYLYVGRKDKNGVFIERTGYSTARTFTTDANTYYVFPYLNRSGFTFTTVGGYIQLEYGSTATTYEEYKEKSYEINLGDIELCKIGDYQDKIFKTSGKNLFDKTTITTSAYLKEDGTLQTGTGAEYVTSDFIPVKPNTTYYKTLTLSPRTKFYDINKQVLDSSTYQDTSIGGNAGSFTTPNNAYYFRFTGNVNTSTGININLTMVNEGSSSIPYEPYGKNEWYLKKEIGKVVLDGSETISRQDMGNGTYRFHIRVSDIRSFNSNELPNILSDKFIEIMRTNIYNYTEGITSTTNLLMIYYDMFKNMTDAQFKTWLSNNNTIVYYPLATPTYTKIEDEELISQLEETKYSYNNQTNISQVNDDLPFELNVSALKEM